MQVGILRGGFVAVAQATLDAKYGCGVFRVFDTEQAYFVALAR